MIKMMVKIGWRFVNLRDSKVMCYDYIKGLYTYFIIIVYVNNILISIKTSSYIYIKIC